MEYRFCAATILAGKTASIKPNRIKGSLALSIYILGLVNGAEFSCGIAFGKEFKFFGADVAEPLARLEFTLVAARADTVGLS